MFRTGANVLLNALILSDGFDSFGGAIYSGFGTLTICNSTLTGNSSALGGRAQRRFADGFPKAAWRIAASPGLQTALGNAVLRRDEFWMPSDLAAP